MYGAYADYEMAKRKIDAIETGRVRPGSEVRLSARELNAYADHEIAQVAPQGIRQTALELGNGVASASALIDFGRVRRAQGKKPGWLMSKLLDGERPVKITARVRSGGGQMQVDVQSVEVSGIPIEGSVLEFLIQHYLRAYYPQARVGEPFRLGGGVERVDVRPGDVAIAMKR